MRWAFENYWTPRGVVFDIGIATRQAITRLSRGEKPELAGSFDETSNGNGSLMRILPLLFYISPNQSTNVTKLPSKFRQSPMDTFVL